MYLTPLITETYIKQTTPLNNNVDLEEIVNNIEYAQEAFIQDILGTNLYNDIQTKYLAQTLSLDEQTLVMYIKPYLAYKAAEVALPFLQNKVRAKGLVNVNSENAQQADIDRMRYLKDELHGRAEFLGKRLSNYLCDNWTLFPLYSAPNTDMDPSGRSTYECDLWFPTPSCCLKCNSNYDCGCN